jgi:hypothetical protein
MTDFEYHAIRVISVQVAAGRLVTPELLSAQLGVPVVDAAYVVAQLDRSGLVDVDLEFGNPMFVTVEPTEAGWLVAGRLTTR